MTPLLTISELRSTVRETPVPARLFAQATEVLKRESANGKPYFELKLRDSGETLLLRAWNDTPAFYACEKLAAGTPVEISGEFQVNGQFGLEGRRWTVRVLNDEESDALFSATQDTSVAAMEDVANHIESLADPRLKALCQAFLREFGSRFARASAARAHHHARRGGLLDHTAQMLRSAGAISSVYPSLNRDLLLAGTLFHDAGKLWETCPPERGFEIPRDLRGELLGHITIGIEVINSLWRSLPLEEWKDLTPPSETVRLHLLHLVAAHHGQLEFGSPVEPKTPEAIALNAIDNLDAKLEMLFQAATSQPEVAPGLLDRIRPLNIHPAIPLPKFSQP
ncbi:MAG: HD domain-containing protein [Terrimicrobiaceae bacterium]